MFAPVIRRLLACSGLLALTSTLPVRSDAQSAGSGAGAVRGTVRAAGSATPISGATVSIAAPARAVLTGDNGQFTLRNLPAGRYDVVATAVGRTPQHQTVTISAGGTATADFTLAAGSILLPGYVVSATRQAVEASKTAATVNFLTPEQVRTTPARETQDMLREISAIEMPRTSSQLGGVAQIVSIRGVDEGRTAVLVDGIPLNDAWGEWIDWNRAPRGTIDRVEVFEGGGASLHGAGAMGGVISLFSRPLTPGSYRLVTDGGSRDGRHIFGSTALPLTHGLTLGLTADYGDGGGYQLVKPSTAGPIDGISQAITRSGIARLEYAPSANLSAFVTARRYGENRMLGTPLNRGARWDATTDGGLDVAAGTNGRLSVRGWWRDMTDSTVNPTLLTVNSVARAGERLNTVASIPSQDRGLSLAWTRTNWLGFESVVIGGDHRYYGGFYNEQTYANNTANAATTRIKSGGDQLLTGVFASGVLAPVTKVRVELSARADRWGNNNGYVEDASGRTTYANVTRSAFSPRIGAQWQLRPTLSVHSAFYQAFRAPNLAELYRRQVSTSTITLPNPALKPEFATGYEAGMAWQPATWFQMKGTYYDAYYRDFNTNVTTSAAGVTPATRQRQNVQKARSKGGELYVAVVPFTGLTLSGSVNYNDAKITDMGLATSTATLFKGARVARVPVQKSTVRLSYRSPMAGTITLLHRTEGQVTTFGNTFTLPSFRVLDLSYQRPIWGGLSAFGSLENVLNREYYAGMSGTAAVPVITLALPRTLRVGLELTR